MPAERATLKTYSHLAGQRRLPTDYELVSSQLHYYRQLGLEVNVPLRGWYEQHQAASPLTCRDWEQFRDPRETTYACYTALQTRREALVDGLFQSIEDSQYDERLPPAAVQLLARFLAPLRFPVHGLQLLAAYVGQLAPSGRITIAGLLQTSDEVRRLQRLAYRMALLRRVDPAFGEESRRQWQEDPVWQPLRELIERLLVTYDWGEAFVALNLGLKPAFDRLFLVELPTVARAQGDYLLGEICRSLDEDCRWHRAWSAALVRTVLADTPSNREAIQTWLARWLPRVRGAIAPLAHALAPELSERIDDAVREELRGLTLETPP